MNKPFFFIGNIIKIKNDLPIEIAPGFFLKKANALQIKLIKSRLNKFQQVSNHLGFHINSYESDFKKSSHDNSYSIDHLENQNDWKYYILELNCTQDDFDKNKDNYILKFDIIDQAFLLSVLEIQVLWGFMHYNVSKEGFYVDSFYSLQYRPLNFFKKQGIFNPEITFLNDSDLVELLNYIDLLNSINLSSQRDFFSKAIKDFVNIFEIPDNSPFKIIGLIAIIEYLVTSTNSGASINYQLQTKLNLLNNRSKHKMDIHSFFKLPNAFKFEKIIEKIYAYRSDIAHGNVIDFEKRLQVLNDQKLVENFLLKLVKLILIQTLIEPDLLLDLKTC